MRTCQIGFYAMHGVFTYPRQPIVPTLYNPDWRSAWRDRSDLPEIMVTSEDDCPSMPMTKCLEAKDWAWQFSQEQGLSRARCH
jgi:hypothetical protein